MRRIWRGTISRRELVAAAALAPLPLLSPAACAVPDGAPDGAPDGVPGSVSLPDFRRAGDRDDSAALARAFATGRPVHAPAGRGSGPGGVYRIGNEAAGTLPSGATLFGDGIDATRIARAGDAPFILHCDSGSPDPARAIRGLRFRDLSFVDDVARLGFSEFSYLVMLNGVADVRFERVGFRGFRGDGLHLGQGVTSQVERHNRGITVSDCLFDGINANNRNAISVIDVDGLVIERSRFRNVTRRGDGTPGRGDPMDPATGLAQPGAIDLEPNGDPFTIIRNVVIRDNLFVGGGGFAVALLLPPNDAVRTAQQGIVIERNIVRDRFGGFEAFGFAGDGAVRSQRGYGIAIRDNQVDGCEKPFIVSGIRDVSLTGNRFRDCRGHAELGYRAANAQVVLADNLFERVGGPSGQALWLRSGRGIRLTRNRFVDAGVPGGGGGVAIAVVEGTISGLTMAGNQFRSPGGRMTQAATVFRDGRVDQATLRLEGNEALGLPLAQALDPAR